MLKKIAMGVVILVLVVLGLAAMQPDSFRVQRTIAIKAPPEKILPLISDFHNWTSWSPWEKLDPAMKRTYSGAPRDQGAIYAWEGDDKVGAGRMEITGQAPAKVDIKLDFLKPFESHCQTEFALETKGELTTVSWTMSGPSDFMTKLMGLAVSMDTMIGKDFETGLANMKAVAEK
ncbi:MULTISPECIES: SRPBCC family protein [unclassified Duganella]|uniref:SRPBCC family protein n=1 Tax=unclassified Duganella TaxID=2636909 RepID=UPI000E353F94|nr:MULTISPECIES: SRPBCC family protein [unclassified Duganella]RFP18557.1 polyketide cyclase [Duganella sp. BJB475]RFP35222.1 polyketide cyclase [Duganella sp. BJB476]